MDVFVQPVGAHGGADGGAHGGADVGWDWDLFDKRSGVGAPDHGGLDDLFYELFDPYGSEMLLARRTLRKRGWPRVKPYRPRKKRVDAANEQKRMEQCMQVAVQNADLASAILRLDDTNLVATTFKEHCSIAKLQAVPPANADSVASRLMEPYKHLYWDWIGVIETGVMPPLIPSLPGSFVRDIKIVLRKKNNLRWCCAADVIAQAEQMRFQWRQRHVYKREFSEAGQIKIMNFNAMLRLELAALQ